jgi:hypothetical protein
MMHNRWAWAVAVALLLGASVAGAQPATPDREAERAALYEEGVKLAGVGRWSEAVERFRQVVAIRSAPRARFTLGEAEEKSGKLASAKASYALALEEARATGDEQAAGAAGGALAAIERRVPRVMMRLSVGVAGARASVDGREVPLGDKPVELDPGEHRVVASAPGREPFEQMVSVVEGKTTELTVRLDPVRAAGAGEGGAGAAQPIPGRSGQGGPSRDTSGPPAGAWVLGATGLAATAVGVALYVTGQRSYDDAAGYCTAGGCSAPEHADDGNAARGQMIAGDVVMAVGIGALVGAGLWWAAAAGSAPAAEQPAQARLGLGVSRDGLAVMFEGKL